jgi:glycosyltransferase involved in cell wall biosynthesis
LLAWSADLDDLTDVLVWCRRHPDRLRAAFRSAASWERFVGAVDEAITSSPIEAGRAPELDTYDAARLYQTTYWLGRTAAAPTPDSDIALVTAAGWAALPALVHRALHGTPTVLVEHGVYVREAYLANVDAERHGGRFLATRLARGLARAAYASADVVAPVTANHRHWERSLGVGPDRIRVIPNGVSVPDRIESAPRRSIVVSVGRVDPLKDVLTMLRVADEVTRRMPEARFLHYGPVPEGRLAYGESCRELHERLELGERFRFMGSTSDPHGAVRDADVVLMTSISEGFPLSILEAMAQGRPVVSTEVGGVADALTGCGVLAPAGDVYALSLAVCTLLRDPDLAERLGRRGFDRVRRRFTKEACLEGYRALFGELVGSARPAA